MSSGSLWFLYKGAVYRAETGGRLSREVAQTTTKGISEADSAKGMGEVDRATCTLDVMLQRGSVPDEVRNRRAWVHLFTSGQATQRPRLAAGDPV